MRRIRPLLALLAILSVLPQGMAEPQPSPTAESNSKRVSLQFRDADSREALQRLFDSAGERLVLDDAVRGRVTATLSDVPFEAALRALLRANSTGPLAYRIEGGRYHITPAPRGARPSAPPSAPSAPPSLGTDRRYRFRGTISREVLEGYLSRAVTHVGLCATSPEPATTCLDDDIRMLTQVGAKFVGRAAYAWVPPADDDAHFRHAAEAAARVHRADPDVVLQACIFEAVYQDVEKISVPGWAFAEFGLAPEERKFRYGAMLYDGGKLHNHWQPGASVPDVSKRETRLWFYYRARRYIDAGFEALHFGQVHLMDHQDRGHRFWADLLARVRRYAAQRARRGLVLCDAHTRGVDVQGRLLFDFVSYPMRPKEVPGRPLRAQLVPVHGDSIYRRTRGGTTPSGWYCAQLPYLVEFDSYGSSGKGGQPGVGFPWTWGYDEIGWFARLPESERNRWIDHAWAWVRDVDPNGWLQMPTRRNLADPVNGTAMYQANQPSPACPGGFNQEGAIKAIWSRGLRPHRSAAGASHDRALQGARTATAGHHIEVPLQAVFLTPARAMEWCAGERVR